MHPEKKLGRGLDFLLSETVRDQAGEDLLQVPVHQIQPNRFQPRQEFPEEELKELSESIKTHGVLQPLVARRSQSGFELIAGERRLRASQLAGLPCVPVLLRDVTDQQLLALALVENLQRSDLNPIDKAKACRQLLDLSGGTQDEAARELGMSRPNLANLLRLLDLPKPVQASVSRGTLSMGHARALLGLEAPERIAFLAHECEKGGWSVRQLEERVRLERLAKKTPSTTSGKGLPSWHRELEERLSHALQHRVKIHFEGTKARLVIQVPDRESFEHLYERLLSTTATAETPIAPASAIEELLM